MFYENKDKVAEIVRKIDTYEQLMLQLESCKGARIIDGTGDWIVTRNLFMSTKEPDWIREILEEAVVKIKAEATSQIQALKLELLNL